MAVAATDDLLQQFQDKEESHKPQLSKPATKKEGNTVSSVCCRAKGQGVRARGQGARGSHQIPRKDAHRTSVDAIMQCNISNSFQQQQMVIYDNYHKLH